MPNLDGRILTPDGWISGRVEFGEQITAVRSRADDGGGVTILPGFVDLHVPGGGGGETSCYALQTAEEHQSKPTWMWWKTSAPIWSSISTSAIVTWSFESRKGSGMARERR